MTKVCFILFVNIAPAQYISKATLDKPCKLHSINLDLSKARVSARRELNCKKKYISALNVKSFFNYVPILKPI